MVNERETIEKNIPRFDFNAIGVWSFIRREINRIFRVPVQTVVSPLISAFLFIFIFGFVLGRKIELIAGIEYIRAFLR